MILEDNPVWDYLGNDSVNKVKGTCNASLETWVCSLEPMQMLVEEKKLSSDLHVQMSWRYKHTHNNNDE